MVFSAQLLVEQIVAELESLPRFGVWFGQFLLVLLFGSIRKIPPLLCCFFRSTDKT